MLWSNYSIENIEALLSTFFPHMLSDIFVDKIARDRFMSRFKTIVFNLKDIPGVPSSPDRDKSMFPSMFFKNLHDLWCHYREWNVNNIVLIDDTQYKSLWNPKNIYIFPLTFEPGETNENPFYLLKSLCDNPCKYARTHMITNPKVLPLCLGTIQK